MSYIPFGVRQIVVTPLAVGGGVASPAAEGVTSTTPQSVGVEPFYKEGEEHEWRGGDDIVATIKEDDKFMGANLKLAVAGTEPAIIEAMIGGTLIYDTESPPAVIGWECPDSDNVQPEFQLEVWVANYTEEDESAQDGYLHFTFAYCKATVEGNEHQDKNFAPMNVAVRARKNPSTDVNAYKYEKVAAIT